MKVLHVINSLHIGGAEKLLVDFIPLVNKDGVNAEVLLLDGTSTKFKERLISQCETPVYSLGASIYNPVHVFRIIRYLKGYDLVHVHLFPALYFVALAKLLSFSRTPIIFTEHSTMNKRMGNRFFALVDKWIYSFYSRIICITEEVKQSLIFNLGIKEDRLEIINNAIDLDLINRLMASDRRIFGYNASDKLVVMVAAFREEKDQDTLINALSELDENYKLLLIGDGVRRDELQALVERLDLRSRVSFLGLRTDVIQIIKMCDVAVLSSHWEGFGLAAVEAMACGVPLIASNVKGLAQVVGDGGLLFEKGNIKDLVGKIKSLEDKSLYSKVSISGVRKATNFDISRMVNRSIEVYRSVVLAN